MIKIFSFLIIFNLTIGLLYAGPFRQTPESEARKQAAIKKLKEKSALAREKRALAREKNIRFKEEKKPTSSYNKFLETLRQHNLNKAKSQQPTTKKTKNILDSFKQKIKENNEKNPTTKQKKTKNDILKEFAKKIKKPAPPTNKPKLIRLKKPSVALDGFKKWKETGKPLTPKPKVDFTALRKQLLTRKEIISTKKPTTKKFKTWSKKGSDGILRFYKAPMNVAVKDMAKYEIKKTPIIRKPKVSPGLVKKKPKPIIVIPIRKPEIIVLKRPPVKKPPIRITPKKVVKPKIVNKNDGKTTIKNSTLSTTTKTGNIDVKGNLNLAHIKVAKGSKIKDTNIHTNVKTKKISVSKGASVDIGSVNIEK